MRLALVLAPLYLLACEPIRVEYRKTPAFYSQMADVQGLEGGIAKDGTELRFLPESSNLMDGFKDHTGRIFLLRERSADGTVTLNALAPEHVLFNTITCLTNQEYQLLWDEMVSSETKQWYEAEGGGEQVALEFFRVNRQEIVTMLMRMKGSLNLQEVERLELEGGVIRLRFSRQLAHRFAFSEFDTRWEEGKFVLVTIR